MSQHHGKVDATREQAKQRLKRRSEKTRLRSLFSVTRLL